ncbi:MAG TPA: hypothetical protein VHX36_03375 [Candidatus Acidoferrales bacterium]|jgi:hypothetical protein|nr:hypothetical protein [Candidatus Acidoferrales bacterium]
MPSSKRKLHPVWSLHSVVSSKFFRVALLGAVATVLAACPPLARAAGNDNNNDPATDASQPTAAKTPKDLPTKPEPASESQLLLEKINELEARVAELEAARSAPVPVAASAAPPPAILPAIDAPSALASLVAPPSPAAPAPASPDPDNTGGMSHDMTLPGGPVLKFRGFFDFNFGLGSIANPLVFPIIDGGCGTCGNPLTPPHSTFQAGEFDLFLTSKLSDDLSFLTEVVLGPDVTNEFGPDIERYTLTYKKNDYFSVGVGRFHTSIGYYNTAYHHGLWFSTAEGRPIMYLFEDSGGILPVHMVGINFAGAVPKTDKLGLHWIFEVGNGLASNSSVAESVQNFYSDRNYKATNVAGYIKPEFLPGLQIGGSWYHDHLDPTGVPMVAQNIESLYIVYITSQWEFLNEAVVLSNHLIGTSETFRSPMAYVQFAHKFGIYKPYFRYQYVSDAVHDPVNLLKGEYYGPSVGVRIDFEQYAAFKLQYNHLFESSQLAGNGLDAQVAFAF